jgi:DNA-binding NarL/FixJ family response regulator
VNIAVADGHPIVRDELVRAVQSMGAGVKAYGTGNLSRLRAYVCAHPLDMALVCLETPAIGLAGFANLRREFPDLVVVVLSSRDDATTIRTVLGLGAAGFISKTETREVFLQALRLVHAGGVYVPARALESRGLDDGSEGPRNSNGTAFEKADAALTRRESDVLDGLLRGWSNKVIARDLGISEGTVKCHVAAILRKSAASNRTEVVARCWRSSSQDEQLGARPS